MHVFKKTHVHEKKTNYNQYKCPEFNKKKYCLENIHILEKQLV